MSYTTRLMRRTTSWARFLNHSIPNLWSARKSSSAICSMKKMTFLHPTTCRQTSNKTTMKEAAQTTTTSQTWVSRGQSWRTSLATAASTGRTSLRRTSSWVSLWLTRISRMIIYTIKRQYKTMPTKVWINNWISNPNSTCWWQINKIEANYWVSIKFIFSRSSIKKATNITTIRSFCSKKSRSTLCSSSSSTRAEATSIRWRMLCSSSNKINSQ